MSEAWERSLERIRQGEEAERKRRQWKSEKIGLKPVVTVTASPLVQTLTGTFTVHISGLTQTEKRKQKLYRRDLNFPRGYEEQEVFV